MAEPLPGTRHLLRARDLIDRHYQHELKVPALARAAACSPAHFSRGFAQTFGTSPHRYLLERRIERARYLLATTDSPVADIAVEVGFRSSSALCNAFRRMTGATPGAYRRLSTGVWRSEVPSCVLMAWTRPVLEVSTNDQSRAQAGP